MTPLLLTLLAAGKAAPEKPKLDAPARAVVLVVADDADGAKDAAKVQKNLELALKDSAIEVADVASMFAAKASEPEGEKRFKDGLTAYDNLDLDAAELKFKEALTLFIDYPETATANRLATTHLFLGGIALQKGGKQAKKKAQEELSRAVVFKPDVEVDAKFFGPDVKAAVQKALKEVEGRSTAKLELHCDAGTEVTVRGKVVGTCPVPPVTNLPLGRHLVQFSRPGFQPSGVLVDLGSEGAEAKATMAPVEKYAAMLADAKKLASASGWDAAAVPKGAWELSERLKARYLVMVRLHGGASAAQGSLQVWDPDSGNKLKDINVDASQESADSATLAVKTWLASPSPATGTSVAANTSHSSGKAVAHVSQETDGSEPVYKKAWFWGVVGGVVVAGAVATTVVVAQPHPQPFNVVLGTP